VVQSTNLKGFNMMQTIIESLTIDQAMQWDAATDKWVFIDDTILAPANLKATDSRVNAIEDAFMSIIDFEVAHEIALEDAANRRLSCDHYAGF
jgi:hypothetical protein